MTRISIKLADEVRGRLRVAELNVATNMAAIRTLETSISSLKKKKYHESVCSLSSLALQFLLAFQFPCTSKTIT